MVFIGFMSVTARKGIKLDLIIMALLAWNRDPMGIYGFVKRLAYIVSLKYSTAPTAG